MGFLFSVCWKNNNYDPILVIVDYLIKIVYYKLVKTIINIAGLAEVIIDVVISYHSLLKLMVSNKNSLFYSEF